MLFVDSDIVFNPYDVLKLIEHDVPIVSGAYPYKCLSFTKIRDSIHDSHNLQSLIDKSSSHCFDKHNLNELTKVEYAQTGFMLIKRITFTNILSNFKDTISYKNDIIGYDEHSIEGVMYNFFQVGVHENRYLSEDYGFCKFAKDVGMDIYIDPSIKLTHIGQFFFHG
jgi:hypothetical protein